MDAALGGGHSRSGPVYQAAAVPEPVPGGADLIFADLRRDLPYPASQSAGPERGNAILHDREPYGGLRLRPGEEARRGEGGDSPAEPRLYVPDLLRPYHQFTGLCHERPLPFHLYGRGIRAAVLAGLL